MPPLRLTTSRKGVAFFMRRVIWPIEQEFLIVSCGRARGTDSKEAFLKRAGHALILITSIITRTRFLLSRLGRLDGLRVNNKCASARCIWAKGLRLCLRGQ
jgi:hypothetical protein